MPDPVAERVRVGALQIRVVAVAEQAGLGGQVGGDVRGDDPRLLCCGGVATCENNSSSGSWPDRSRPEWSYAVTCSGSRPPLGGLLGSYRAPHRPHRAALKTRVAQGD
jgi:hypothetical protein